MALAISIAICFGAAAIGGMATAGSVTSDWFFQLKKPSWNPPNWIFGPVWSALYFMMAFAAWLVWKHSGGARARVALGWFAFHLLLNIGWSVLFFGQRQIGWAVVEIGFLWLAIVITMALFYRHSRFATAILVPYLLWVSFASFLNYTIWTLN